MFRSFHPYLLSFNSQSLAKVIYPTIITPNYIFKPGAKLLFSFTSLTLLPQGPTTLTP